MILYANSSQTISLPAGQVLTLINPSGSAGRVVRLALAPGGGDSQSTTVIAGANLTFGPYAQPERFNIFCTAGVVTTIIMSYDPSLYATDVELVAILSASITNGDMTHAPNGDAVFDALALKAPLANPTFTGTQTCPLLCIGEKTPINAVAASKVLTSDNTEVTDGDTVTIGTTVYRFKDTMAAAYDVKRHGTTADTTMENLIAAINASGTEGVEYFAGTLIHPTVSAGTLADHAFTATAKTKGVSGNSIAIAEASTHLSWADGAVFLSGGVDGTVGVANETCADGTYLYHCLAINTIADANWRKMTLNAL